MTEKRAIFCVALGKPNKMYDCAIKSFEQYAKKVNAELIVHRERHFNVDWPISEKYQAHKIARYAWLERLYAVELLKQYDRVLLLDCDIIIHPKAEDIFSTYPDTSKVYALNDSLYTKTENAGTKDIDDIESILGKVAQWPITNNKKRCFNAGTILLSKNRALSDNFNLLDIEKIFNQIEFFEQTYLNYLITKLNIPFCSIDPRFSWIPWIADRKKRHNAFFIHHAREGFGVSTILSKDTFFYDYNKYYHPIKFVIQFIPKRITMIYKLMSHNIGKLL